jgi:enediyne biosynthesis protein E4
VVAPADVDGDGDIDLFVGGRSIPWKYGADPASQLLMNDGRGRFTDAAAHRPGLPTVGMVTDAVWNDVDGDKRPDLVHGGRLDAGGDVSQRGNGRFER